VPSPRTSIGVGYRPIEFGADLNFVCQESRTFPGLTAPRSAHVCGQDLVCPSHGVRAMVQLRAHRAALLRQRGRAHTVVCRAVPRDGLRAVDLAREPSRHQSEPLGQCEQALCDGLSIGGQALDAGRCKRIARLAYLVRSDGRADPSRAQALRERVAQCRVGQHRVCAGLQHHRSVPEPV
jgi:hypothetical protein